MRSTKKKSSAHLGSADRPTEVSGADDEIYTLQARDLRVIFANVLSGSQPLDQEMTGSLRLHHLRAQSSVDSGAGDARPRTSNWLSFESFCEALLAAACFCDPNPFTPHDIKFRVHKRALASRGRSCRKTYLMGSSNGGDVVILPLKKCWSCKNTNKTQNCHCVCL